MGKNFRDCINKMEPDHLREDLRQEVILIICELPEHKILALHERKELEFFTVRIILNQVKSNTSPFAKKYRQINQQYLEHDYMTTVADHYKENLVAKIGESIHHSDKFEIEERRLREDIEQIALEEVDKLYWYNKGLIELYLKHGNFRAIEKETGIPYGSCYKTIKKSFNQIKEKIAI